MLTSHFGKKSISLSSLSSVKLELKPSLVELLNCIYQKFNAASKNSKKKDLMVILINKDT
jgi:hypothetical protein